MDIKELFSIIAKKEASDMHLCAGVPPMMRINGRLEKMSGSALGSSEIAQILKDIIPPEKNKAAPSLESDFGIAASGIGRFRVNLYHDRNGMCVAMRFVPSKVRPLESLGLPETLFRICNMHKGLVLFTGTTGSGKSTTIAAIIEKINAERSEHIVTIEDPIEFVHENNKCIINQREIGSHSNSFPAALRAALREDPNIIVVGELRDLDTISMAITAAETGHLVLATLHAKSAAESISRIVDVFPAHQQDQIREELAEVLEMVIYQVLIPSIDGQQRHVACEVMVVNSPIRSHIRRKEVFQIENEILAGRKDGMQTLDDSLKALIAERKIAAEKANEWTDGKPVE